MHYLRFDFEGTLDPRLSLSFIPRDHVTDLNLKVLEGCQLRSGLVRWHRRSPTRPRIGEKQIEIPSLFFFFPHSFSSHQVTRFVRAMAYLSMPVVNDMGHTSARRDPRSNHMPLGSDRQPARQNTYRIEGLTGRRERCSVPYALIKLKRMKTIPSHLNSITYTLICLNGNGLSAPLRRRGRNVTVFQSTRIVGDANAQRMDQTIINPPPAGQPVLSTSSPQPRNTPETQKPKPHTLAN